ncbi:MAG: hypothetical protein Q9188_006352 [Gyalolechia gomerana]
MDHGHGGMDMPSHGPKCNMNMLFTWDTTNLCIIFPQWRIYSTFSLFMSLIGVIVLTAGYELVRDMSRRFEASSAEYMNKLPSKLSDPQCSLRATVEGKFVMGTRG